MPSNPARAVTKGLKRTDQLAIVIHNTCHCGKCHKCCDQEKYQREDTRDVVHPLSVAVEKSSAFALAAIEHINVRRLQIVNLLLGVVELLRRF